MTPSMGLSEREKIQRRVAGLRRYLKEKGGQGGDKNPNWKGGISKDNYHYKKLQVERYPERVRARVAVQHAIRSGRLAIGVCEKCGSENVQAHHDNYSKPLEVRWLCRKHHGRKPNDNLS